MTVVAWDGEYLVADRQRVGGSHRFEVTKLIPVGSCIAVAVGVVDFGQELIEWFQYSGRSPEAWPAYQMTEKEWATLVVGLGDGSVGCYYQRPALIKQPAGVAWGSGADFAVGAMAHGASAIEAVIATNKVCKDCGFGYDAYRWSGSVWIPAK